VAAACAADGPYTLSGCSASIALGNQHSCAILSGDLGTKCWGSGDSGRLGLGDTENRGDGPNEMGDSLPLIAVDLGAARTAIQIATGRAHTCAILDNNELKCWGKGGHGRLGSGGTTNVLHPSGQPAVNLGSGRHAVYIVAGNAHTCAILDNTELKCWGKGDHGRLGLGDVVNRGDGG
jgi:alpha-tubulin suppressor-like RCC1 family protein